MIENGGRRTRRSTLGRVAAALTDANPSLGDEKPLADALAELAGPALAPESPHAERIARRRQRRKRQEREANECVLAAFEELRRATSALPAHPRYDTNP